MDKIVKRKPNTAGERLISYIKTTDITEKKPEKSLTRTIKKVTGRDGFGHISIRHRGGGVKRKYRIISDLSKQAGKPANVISIEYDPNRTGRIAKIQFEDNKKAYILAPQGLKVGDEVRAGEDIEEEIGNRLPLKSINTGTQIFAIELIPGRGAQIAKSAGNYATILSKEGKTVSVKMPSGEIRLFNENCYASIGAVSNPLHSLVRIGKAGRIRHMNRRPQVRGKAMNPVDHPHGGGEGHQPIGLKHPKTPWGKPAMGYRTRKKNKDSNRLIIKRRKQ